MRDLLFTSEATLFIYRFCLEQPLGSSKRSALWKVMICYVENVQCVVMASKQLTNSEHVLLGQSTHL